MSGARSGEIIDGSEDPALEVPARELGEETLHSDCFVAETNADPRSFVWTADPRRVLAAVKRGEQALESVH
jgi:hypothetical protein